MNIVIPPISEMLCTPDCKTDLRVPSAMTQGEFGGPETIKLFVSINGIPSLAPQGYTIPLCNLPVDELIALIGGAAMDPCCPQTNTTLADILAELKKPIDNEMLVLCNAAGESVLVQYDTTAVPPVINFQWNMVTQADEPAGSVLAKCPTAVAIETSPVWACLSGQSIPGIAVLNDALPPAVIAELWRNPATGVWGALPAGAVIGACAGSATGTPAIGSAYANDLSTLPTATSVSVQKPAGSVVQVTTSAGSFLISASNTGFAVVDFKTPVTVQSVTVISGAAALTDIIVTAQRDA